MISKSHPSPLSLRRAPGQLSTAPQSWFLGHKLWQESGWLSCPASSAAPHTHTSDAPREKTEDLLTTGSVAFFRQRYLSRARERGSRRVRERMWRKEREDGGRREEEEMKIKRQGKEKQTRLGQRRQRVGEREREIKRQKRKVIIWKVWRSQSDSLTVLRQRWVHELAPAVCVGMKDEYNSSVDLKG